MRSETGLPQSLTAPFRIHSFYRFSEHQSHKKGIQKSTWDMYFQKPTARAMILPHFIASFIPLHRKKKTLKKAPHNSARQYGQQLGQSNSNSLRLQLISRTVARGARGPQIVECYEHNAIAPEKVPHLHAHCRLQDVLDARFRLQNDCTRRSVQAHCCEDDCSLRLVEAHNDADDVGDSRHVSSSIEHLYT